MFVSRRRPRSQSTELIDQRQLQHYQSRRHHHTVNDDEAITSSRLSLFLPHDIIIHSLRPFLCDNDAIHLMQTTHNTVSLYQLHPYSLRHEILAPSDLTVLARRPIRSPLRILRLSIFDLSDHGYEDSCTEQRNELTIVLEQKIMVDTLPSSLTHLTVGNWSVHIEIPITPDILPKSLIHLTFAEWFNQPIQLNSLPSGLTRLEFGDDFNHIITPGLLPNTLTHLELGLHYCSDHPIPALPPSLQSLKVYSFGHAQLTNHLPPFLRSLYIGELNGSIDAVAWPPLLTSLYIWAYNGFIDVVSWPSTLTDLRFGGFNQPISAGSLPPSLLHLTLGIYFCWSRLWLRQSRWRERWLVYQ